MTKPDQVQTLPITKGRKVPSRFIFRQVQFEDLPVFLGDGEIRSKNHGSPQRCHQASYQEIVDRRGTNEFRMPDRGVVNDYVPFYFSPITSFTFTIFKRNVGLRSPDGALIGQASEDDRVFLVSSPDRIRNSGQYFCFSDHALNSRAPMPNVETDLEKIETHIDWEVFDDNPLVAEIPEIGYLGVCQFFKNRTPPATHMTRSSKRMAEFLVCEAVPLNEILCVITKTDDMRDRVEVMIATSDWDIPVYTKRGCYFG
jgi:hypothetical protein